MYQKICKFWTSLNQDITVNKRELFLGVTACALAGILTGMFLSPRKTVTIGSNNGNYNTDCKGVSVPQAEPDALEADAPEADAPEA